MTTLVERIVGAIHDVVGDQGGFTALHEPCFSGREWEYVKDCLDTGWVSSVGEYVNRFEKQLADIAGCRHAIATSSGTSALHICLELAGAGLGDEVLVPTLSFVATANAVKYTGAEPHFVDCDKATLAVDPALLEAYLGEIGEIRGGTCYNKRTGKRIQALVVVHMLGHPCRIDALAEVASRYHLTLVEDAAEALGSTYRGRHAGQWGCLAALSFNGNKTITTGGGGAVLTDDDELASVAKHLTTTAKVPHQWEARHDRVGYNYRLPNLNAALGCAQLEQLPAFIESKRELARRYAEAFEGLDGVQFVLEPDGCRSNYWLCSLLLDEDHACHLETLLERTNSEGIMTRPAWNLLHELPMYAECQRSTLTFSESISRGLINLPSSPGLCLA